jgi:hypothetical protein
MSNLGSWDQESGTGVAMKKSSFSLTTPGKNHQNTLTYVWAEDFFA